jgi:hypothetical protein
MSQLAIIRGLAQEEAGVLAAALHQGFRRHRSRLYTALEFQAVPRTVHMGRQGQWDEGDGSGHPCDQ